MKVICIDTSEFEGEEVNTEFYLKEGEIYTVKEIFTSEDDIECYSLTQDDCCDDYGFPVNKFVPLSEIDEIELVNRNELANR